MMVVDACRSIWSRWVRRMCRVVVGWDREKGKGEEEKGRGEAGVRGPWGPDANARRKFDEPEVVEEG